MGVEQFPPTDQSGLYLYTSGDQTVAGIKTFTSPLTAAPAIDTVPLVVQRGTDSSPTAHLFDLKNHAGTILTFFDQNGTLSIQPTSDLTGLSVRRGTDSSPTISPLAVLNAAANTYMFQVRAFGHVKITPTAESPSYGAWSLLVARGTDTTPTEPLLTLANHAVNVTLVQFSARGALLIQPDAEASPLTLKRGTDTTPTLDLVSIQNAAGAVLTRVTFDGSLGAPNVPGYNFLDNGSLSVWQRGTSVTPGAAGTAVYTADRWRVVSAGAAVASIAQTAVTGYSTRFGLIVTGATSVTTVNIGQRMEGDNVFRLLGSAGGATANSGYVTFSFLLTNTTGASMAPTLLVGTPAALDNFTTVTNKLSQALTAIPSATTALVSFSVLASTVAGWTNVGFGLQVELQIPSGSMVAAKSVTLLGAKVEVGAASTPIIPMNYQQELARCQRYYYRQSSGYICAAHSSSTTNAYGTLRLPQLMRAAGVLGFSAASAVSLLVLTATVAGTALANAGAAPDSALLQVTTGASQTAGTCVQMFVASSSWIDVTADL